MPPSRFRPTCQAFPVVSRHNVLCQETIGPVRRVVEMCWGMIPGTLKLHDGAENAQCQVDAYRSDAYYLEGATIIDGCCTPLPWGDRRGVGKSWLKSDHPAKVPGPFESDAGVPEQYKGTDGTGTAQFVESGGPRHPGSELQPNLHTSTSYHTNDDGTEAARAKAR
jgi:hypothetical protein